MSPRRRHPGQPLRVSVADWGQRPAEVPCLGTASGAAGAYQGRLPGAPTSVPNLSGRVSCLIRSASRSGTSLSRPPSAALEVVIDLASARQVPGEDVDPERGLPWVPDRGWHHRQVEGILQHPALLGPGHDALSTQRLLDQLRVELTDDRAQERLSLLWLSGRLRRGGGR